MSTNMKRLNFKKRETTIIKGVVILLMVFHHLFGFENEYFDSNYCWSSIGVFGKICVSVYAFLGGYGLYSSLVTKPKFDSVKRILNLMVRYWICLTIIILIDVLCGNYLFESGELAKLLLNYLCIFFSRNAYAWFLLPYFVFILLLPVINWAINRINIKPLRVIIEILCIAIPLAASIVSYSLVQEVGWLYNTVVYSLIMMIPFFLMGCFFSKYHLFEKIAIFANASFFNAIIGTLLMIGVFFARKNVFYSVYGMNMFDLVLAPIFILSVLILCNGVRAKWVSLLFEKNGHDVYKYMVGSFCLLPRIFAKICV